MVKDWIRIYTSSEEYQAALIVELLKNHGLHPVLMDRRDDEFLIGEAEVYVAPEEAEDAKKVIDSNSEQD